MRVEIITEAEIMIGLHDYVQNYKKREARCRRCGRLATDVMNDSRSPGCKGAEKRPKGGKP